MNFVAQMATPLRDKSMMYPWIECLNSLSFSILLSYYYLFLIWFNKSKFFTLKLDGIVLFIYFVFWLVLYDKNIPL